MAANSSEFTPSSCPFAEARADGCICIALNESKRVSVDYQARFCLTARHVQCRRFQRAVPEIPDTPVAPGLAERFERRTFLVAGVMAFSVIVLIAAVTFRGSRSGWFSDQSASASNGTTAAVVQSTPTVMALAAITPTPIALEPTPAASSVPVLSSTAVSSPTAAAAGTVAASPTPIATSASTVTPAPTVAAPTASPTAEASAPEATPDANTTVHTPATHEIIDGETLSTIGEQYGVSASLIAAANGINIGDVINSGSTLYIPDSSGKLPADAPYLGVHIVEPGDTLALIANEFGVSVQNLMYQNGISDADIIQVGSVLAIPKGDVAPQVTQQSPAPSPQITYTVQHGDTLYAISKQFGVTIEALMEANGLTDRAYVVTGQVLIIPST